MLYFKIKMIRREFLTYLSIMGIAGISTKLLSLIKNNKTKQPLIFFGHGSPMNAIENNEFSSSWKNMAKDLNPQAILVISAHWETAGTKVFSGNVNKIIYDFFGFPNELYQVTYPAPSNSLLAKEINNNLSKIELSNDWGLDHGAWSVLIHAFPKAQIPVIQLSLNKNLTIKDHFQLAKEIKTLRNNGVLVIGSGNIVHNLRKLSFDNSKTYDWANNFQSKVLDTIKQKKFSKLLELSSDIDFNNSHPTIEHYLPLIYIASMADELDNVDIFTPKIELGSISMASFLIK